MAIPKQALEAEAQANALLEGKSIEEINAILAQEDAKFDGPSVPVPVEQKPQPESEAAKAELPPVTPNEQAPQQAAPEAPPAIQPKQEATQDDGYKHKYDVLKGKYDAEVPRLSKENKELRFKIETLENVISKLSNGQPQLTTNSSQPSHAPKGKVSGLDFSDEEKEEFGESYLRKMEDIARKAGGDKESIIQELNALKWQQFNTRLTSRIPDAISIGESEEFNDWLKSKRVYKSLVDAASSLDDETVAYFINEYKKSIEADKPVVNPPIQPVVNAPNPLERQIAPVKSSVPSTPQEKPKYSMKQYKQIYDDIARGRYSKEESAKMMAVLDDAVADGRITN